MKKLLLTIIIVFIGLTSILAQSSTTSFDVNGIKVIFKPTLKNVINVRIYYRGGVTNYPAGKAGIEDLALQAVTQCGTKKYKANAFKDTADNYGALFAGESTYDYGYIQVNCISKYFNRAWDLFCDAVTDPAFDTGEFALLKDRDITAVTRRRALPANRLHDVQMRNIFANTPYAISPIGTEQTVGNITADDVKDYYKTLLNKNKIFIVAVGNITKEELYQKILTAFDRIPSSPYTTPELVAPAIKDNKLISDDQEIKTNYVSAVMNAPEFNSADYVPFKLAIAGVGGNLYANLHSMQNLSYDPSVTIQLLRMPYVTMSASSTNPQQVMFAMVGILKSIQQRGYNEEWLQHVKNGYITGTYVDEQSATAITDNLGIAEILGNWHFSDDFPQLVNMVTVDQVNDVINTYIKGLRWNYVGNVDAIQGFKLPGY